MKQRYTIETLASGQPRPYADAIKHVRVTMEAAPWDAGDGELAPSFMGETTARMTLGRLGCGFVSKPQAELKWFDTRLDWLKPIDGKPASEIIPGGDPKQTVASVWEFHTTTPFTD